MRLDQRLLGAVCGGTALLVMAIALAMLAIFVAQGGSAGGPDETGLPADRPLSSGG